MFGVFLFELNLEKERGVRFEIVLNSTPDTKYLPISFYFGVVTGKRWQYFLISSMFQKC